MSDAAETPILDLLRSVPSDARMIYERSPIESQSIPVGSLAAKAAATIERLTAEVAALKTVMVAAAEEIHAHWQAHCDAEGYGPQNLMRRLEEGIPSEYGYTAGAFAKLTTEVAALREDAERYRLWRAEYTKHTAGPESEWSELMLALADAWEPADVDAAIDAARKEQT